MKLVTELTVSGSPSVTVFANRLRAAADQAEADAATMTALGGNPAVIVGGNNVSFTFEVESTKP